MAPADGADDDAPDDPDERQAANSNEPPPTTRNRRLDNATMTVLLRARTDRGHSLAS